MRRFAIKGASVAADTDGFGNDVTGASFTLTATSAGDGLAHKVIVTNNTGNSHAGKTIALVGTDANGNAQTETLTGPAGSATSTSTKRFLTLESPVLPSATIGADTFDIGWTADSVTPWVHVGRINNPQGAFAIGFGCAVLAGSPTYTVEHCHGNSDASVVFPHSTVSAETTSQEGAYTTPIEAFRLQFAAAGTVEMAGNWVV